MIDILLMIWSCLLMVSLFTSYLMITMTSGDMLSFFPIMMLLMGVVFMFLVNKKQRRVQQAIAVLQKGYEKNICIGCYVVLFSINLIIIVGIYKTISLTSPILLLSWILPMLCYSLYQSIWLCFEDGIHIPLSRKIEVIPYQKIKEIQVLPYKKKVQLIIYTKKERFTYITKEKNTLKMKEYSSKKNPNIKLKDEYF